MPRCALSRDELVEVYEIWKLLGSMAAARAAMMASREQVLEAVELVARMRTEDVGEQWADHNIRFHGLIENAGSGPRLAGILGEFRKLTESYIRASILSQGEEASRDANAEHEEILRAVMTGDPEAAADATLRHLDSSLRGLLELRLVEPATSVPQVPAVGY